MILISCGFDAHCDDPLAAMNVTREGFRDMGAIVRALADDLCEGRLMFVLEGGYAASGLIDGVNAVLDAITGDESLNVPKQNAVSAGNVLDTIVEQVSDAHHL
jgi:acetoin utilization deacetylase AcuC-like enzyme